MSMYKVVEVNTSRDLKRFIKFPLELYKNCPQYVPALNVDQKKSLTSCSTSKYCLQKMWMVLDGKKVVGRICGMINPRYNERYGTSRARFGWFDVIDDFEVARLLLETAESWAVENGMNDIHGPLYYNTLGKQGMLVEGYENVPPFNCLYNFPYYNDFLVRLGYEKECDWLQYKLRIPEDLPEKVKRVSERLMERYKLVHADIDRLKKDKEQVHEFFRIYNESFSQTVHNFIPFTDEEIEEEAASMIPLLDSRISTILQTEDGEIAGFGINFPSISKGLQKAKGRVFPFGWWHMLRALHNYETVDLMINGAAPQWQGKGISAIYHSNILQQLHAAGTMWAITNPQIENNSAVNVWASYDSEPYMRRRCYIKKIK